MGQVVQKVRRVWCGEAEYEKRTDIKEEFDKGSDEWFKVIVDETDEELELRLTKENRILVLDQINAIRRKLDAFIDDHLDMLNTYGLIIVRNNLDGIDIRVNDIHLKPDNQE